MNETSLNKCRKTIKAEIGGGGLPENRVHPYKNQSILILNHDNSTCISDQCNSLLSVVRMSIRVKSIQQHNAERALNELSPEPELIVLQLPKWEATQARIVSCKETWPRASIIALLCGESNRKVAEDYSFLSKIDDFVLCPYSESELLLRIRRLLQARLTTAASLQNLDANEAALHFGALVGKSESFVSAINKVPPLAQSDSTVLICGETGTGKELFARAIHYHSVRRQNPFIPVNCAALPDHLFENELFGHVRGAFTDATSSEKGLIAEAEGGTLILDEVDALSRSAQAKLLRFLQNGEYRPLGSSRGVTANVRVVAATNADLFDRVKAKLFREDLYYRLNALSVTIPPLRERTDDILHLANHFLAQYAKERKIERRGISGHALRKLMSYEWPGNVRELENVIFRALVLTASVTLQPEDINLPQQSLKPAQDNALLRQAKTGVIQDFERGYLTKLLAAYHGNITRAAMAAGKQRSTLQRLLRKYSLNPKSFRS